jgi:organic radical activating enzyme
MEDFYTIQGEGYNTGKAAYFIRLAGCDVGCVWCDVKDSWHVEHHPVVELDDIMDRIRKSGADKVVVTGGEPAMYDLRPLTEAIHARGISCYLETSGAYPLTGSWDWVCVSPKKFKSPLKDVLARADELKVIVYNKSDLAWAEEKASSTRPGCKLFLQPEYSVLDKVLPLIIQYVKSNTKWSISLQTHKVMNVP